MTEAGGAGSARATHLAFRRMVLVVAALLPPMIVAELAFAPTATRTISILLILAAGGSLAACLLALGAGGPWSKMVLPVVAILDSSAIACAAILPVGLDIALILPFLSAVLLVSVFDGWQLRAGLVAGWVCGIAGSALARSTPGMLAIPHVAPVGLAVAMTAAATGLGYLALGWVAAHWRAATAEARRAAELARTAEKAHQRSAEELRALVEASPLPTIAYDKSGNVHAWNPAAERLLGWTQAEAIGRHCTEFVPEEMRDAMAARANQALSEGRLAGPRRSRVLRKDGEQALVEVYEELERDEAGRPAGVIAQFLDVTDREAIEARLMEAQRLEAVGQLAGGIAHDFNNSLTAIAGFASLIASGESPDPREDARTILGAAEHAATLTRQLLAFSRRVPLQPQLLDLREFALGVEPLVRRLIGETISVRVETDRQPALVEVDPSSLEQAILNLAANARDAMPLGGELVLAVRSYPACLGAESAEPQSHVAVAVSDTGTGIPPASMRHLFEPFFTTKPPGKGTGLGLPMVHGFVAQSGGHVVVASPPGEGATVELHFPRASGKVSRVPPRARSVGGTETILFVEDDPGVASFGLACLRRLGYDVTPAMNGTEAVSLAASRPKPFDLLLTDVVIPGMSGPELAALLHRQHPGTAILYASGYSAEHVDEAIVGPDAPLLEKPYSLEQLASKVREVLDRHPQSDADAVAVERPPEV